MLAPMLEERRRAPPCGFEPGRVWPAGRGRVSSGGELAPVAAQLQIWECGIAGVRQRKSAAYVYRTQRSANIEALHADKIYFPVVQLSERKRDSE